MYPYFPVEGGLESEAAAGSSPYNAVAKEGERNGGVKWKEGDEDNRLVDRRRAEEDDEEEEEEEEEEKKKERTEGKRAWSDDEKEEEDRSRRSSSGRGRRRRRSSSRGRGGRLSGSSPGPMENNSGKRSTTFNVPVCKDFGRGRCVRGDYECRYAHPPVGMATEPTPEGDAVTVCNDFLRERCTRGPACRYYHPPPHIRQAIPGIPDRPDRVVSAAMVAAIPPPPVVPLNLAGMAGGGGGMRPALEVCRDYLRNCCTREASDCRFAHTTPSTGQGNMVTVCQDFLKGRCERDSCRYFHPPEHLKPRIRDLPQGGGMLGSNAIEARINAAAYQAAYQAYAASLLEMQQQAAKRIRLEAEEYGPVAAGLHGVGAYGLPLDGSRLRKSPLESSYPYGHGGVFTPPPPSISLINAHGMGNPDHDKLPVCRDFLKDKCVRGSSCRYVHPDANTAVVDNCVTVCRDSLKGRCQREVCRFYHPPAKREAA